MNASSSSVSRARTSVAPAGILVGCLLMAASCALGCQQKTPSEIVAARLTEIAGPSAQDCTRSGPHQDPGEEDTCVVDSVRSHKPFRVQYHVPEKPIPREVGIAADAEGKGYVVTVESEDPAVDSSQIIPEPDPVVVPLEACPVPLRITATSEGYLSCL